MVLIFTVAFLMRGRLARLLRCAAKMLGLCRALPVINRGVPLVTGPACGRAVLLLEDRRATALRRTGQSLRLPQALSARLGSRARAHLSGRGFGPGVPLRPGATAPTTPPSLRGRCKWRRDGGPTSVFVKVVEAKGSYAAGSAGSSGGLIQAASGS